jgi:hypothetical protein
MQIPNRKLLESIGNLILFDVLHHLSMPMMFFLEASRILRPGGRMVIMEPYISPVSLVIYKVFHPEPVLMNCNPFDSGMVKSSNRPFDSNQAIPTLIFFRFLKQWEERFSEFVIKTRKNSLSLHIQVREGSEENSFCQID